MLKLRPYKPCDAEKIVSWCDTEIAFRKWSSDRFESFPITEYDLNEKYINNNGDCTEKDNFYPMTALDDDDDNNVVGHLIMRYINNNPSIIRLGFIIVDNSKRGKGYGKGMLELAIKYAFEILKAEKVTLGVFDNNMPAYHCYKSVGFKEVKTTNKETFNFSGEVWSIIELEMNKEDYES